MDKNQEAHFENKSIIRYFIESCADKLKQKIYLAMERISLAERNDWESTPNLELITPIR